MNSRVRNGPCCLCENRLLRPTVGGGSIKTHVLNLRAAEAYIWTVWPSESPVVFTLCCVGYIEHFYKNGSDDDEFLERDLA